MLMDNLAARPQVVGAEKWITGVQGLSWGAITQQADSHRTGSLMDGGLGLFLDAGGDIPIPLFFLPTSTFPPPLHSARFRTKHILSGGGLFLFQPPSSAYIHTYNI